MGDTPSTQFVGWRLSLSNSFIILVSQYVSIDGLVSWKSTKLGANFYSPNIFAKSVKELNAKILNDGATSYDIDIMIISGTSLKSFEENCLDLVNYSNPNTTILVSADFAVELEPIVIKILEGNCKCVMSICCAVECRQLSLGSYALVNDENCSIFVGSTYLPENYTDEPRAKLNNDQVKFEMSDLTSQTNIVEMVNKLKATKWITVNLLDTPILMAIALWKLIIPRISLNILSIIYEQFDYDILLQNSSTEHIFKDLVVELINIAKAQCNHICPEYYDSQSNKILFNAIIDSNKQKRQELINTTSNEYPEYLSLPFEPYCFYHKFEFPVHILLYQPLMLAKKYNVSCSNLNFLFGFYSRLLVLNGLSIYGGLCEKNNSLQSENNTQSVLLNKSPTLNPNGIRSSKKKKGKKKKHKHGHHKSEISTKKSQLNVIKNKFAYEDASLFQAGNVNNPNNVFSPGLEDLYLNSGNFSSLNNTTSPNIPASGNLDFYNSNIAGKKIADNEFEVDSELLSNSSISSNSSDSSDSASDEDDDESKNSYKNKKEKYYNEEKSVRTEDMNNIYNDYEISELATGQESFRYKKYSEGLADMGVTELPTFVKKFSNKSYFNPLLALTSKNKNKNLSANERPYTTSSLEFQVRNSCDILSKEYYTLRQQIFDLEIQQNQDIRDKRRKRYIQMELKLWKLQRRFNIYRGTVSRVRTGPYDDLLDHIEILNKGNTGDILRWTTSRYGEVDSYETIQNDKEEIMTMFEKKLKNYQYSKKEISK